MNTRQLMLNQNSWMSSSRGLQGLRGVYQGNYVDAPSGSIMFLDSQGNTLQTAECGTPLQFVVKDYVQVWLRQTHDGAPQWDGLLDVPVTYTTSCWNAPGLYHGQVFDVNMVPIGEYDFTMTGSMLSGLSTSLLIAGAALLFLAFRRKRRA